MDELGAREDALYLQLDGFEGPLDLLLDLARKQKVDLARISVLALAEQYLAIVESARQVRLELAADWLVMAAWLAWLKSRLLVPAEAVEPEAELAAETLAERLRALEAMRRAAGWLAERKQLGLEVFARGQPTRPEVDRSVLSVDLPGLLRSYTACARRAAAARAYVPERRGLWTVQDALARLSALLGTARDWTNLAAFLPAALPGLPRRAAVASTFLAGLEMARDGRVLLRQDAPFGPLLVRAAEVEMAGAEATA
jgi:segregation and condensation protein A